MDIGKAFVDSWNIYIKNFIIILLAGIVASILSILVAPLVGFYMMFVKAKRGVAISFNDVFGQFGKFVPLFFGAIWIGILMLLILAPGIVVLSMGWNNTIGGLLLAIGILADIYLGVCWMYALYIIADKGLGINASLSASRALVTKNNWWMHLLLMILAGIVAGIGNVAWGIGSILTMPIGMGAIACAYAEEAK